MSEDLDVDWPAEDEPSPAAEEEEVPSLASDSQGEGADVEPSDDNEQNMDEVQPPAPWTLPIRAAPILALQGEEVVEFPLSQHLSGYESTSVIVDDKLMRIVEARYDPDGVRRLNVRMALVKEHISGYSHTHLDMFDKLKFVWWAAIGAGLLFATSAFQGLFVLGGGVFVLAGLAGLLMSKLDLHRLSFSDHGGRHDFYLSGWRQEPYLIHNSTALLGPAFVDFLRHGDLDTEHIDLVIETMGKSAQPAPELSMAPLAPEPLPEPAQPLALPAPLAPAVEATQPSPSSPSGPPVGPPVAAASEPLPPLPPPPAAAPVPMPAPLPEPAPPSLPAPPPPIASLPPAPLPPPAQLKSNVDEDALWDDLT